MASSHHVPHSSLFANKSMQVMRLFFLSFFTSFLFVLTVLLLLLLVKRELPIPGFLLASSHETLKEENLTATFGRIVFSPPNRIIVEKLSLGSLIHDSPLVEVDRALVELNVTSWRGGWISLQSFSADGVHLLRPSPLPGAGTPINSLGNLSIMASRNHRGWFLHRLGSSSEDLSILVSGGPLPQFQGVSEEKEPKPWGERLAEVLHEITLKEASLPNIRKGLLQISIKEEEKNSLQARIDFQAESIQSESHFNLRHPRLHSVLSLDGSFFVPPVKVSLSAGKFSYDSEKVSLKGIDAELHFDPLPGTGIPFPREGKISATSTSIAGVEAGVFQGDFKRLEEDEFSFILDLFHVDGSLQAEGEVRPAHRSGRMALTSTLPIGKFLRSEVVQELEWSDRIDLAVPPEINLTLLVDPGWSVKELTGEVRARQIIAGEVPLDRAHLIAEWVPPVFLVSQAVLQQGDFKAEGSYAVHAETKDFRFLLNGSLRPAHIAPWFSPWWGRFWEEFAFFDEPPVGDIDIQGRWQDLEKLSIIGSGNSEKLQIRGVDVASMETRYRIRSDFMDIYDVVMKRPEGEVSGEYQHWMDANTSDWKGSEFAVESSFDGKAIAGMLRDPVDAIFAPFSFRKAPRVSATGKLYASANAEKNLVYFQGETEESLSYHGFPLENLFVQGRLQGDDTDLDEIRLGFAQGRAGGNAHIDNNGEEKRLSFKMALAEADFERALEHVVHFRNERNSAEEDEKEQQQKFAGFGGTLELELEAEGELDDLLSYNGEGNFTLRDSDLGEIHIFGLLSRLLSGTPLRFTSLQLSEASSTFNLQKTRVSFPDMKIKGPTVRLESHGDYTVGNQNLDFRVKIFLLSRSRIPLLSLLALPIMDPLGHLLEVRLDGSLTTPSWRFSIDPRNILDPQSSP